MDLRSKYPSNEISKKIMAQDIYNNMKERLKKTHNIKEIRINQETIILIKLYKNTNFINIRTKIINVLNKMSLFDLVDVRYDQLFKLYIIDFK